MICSVLGYSQQWQWAKFADTATSSSSFNQLATDSNSNIYLSINHLTNYPHYLKGSTVIKTDISGNKIWRKNFFGEIGINDIAYGNNSIFICGIITNSVQVGNTTFTCNGPSDIFIAKYTLTGNFLWAESFGGNGEDYANDLTIDFNGDIYFTGACSDSIIFGSSTYSFQGYRSAFVTRLNGSGNVKSAKIFSSSSNSGAAIGRKIATDQNGIYLLGGFADDIYLDTNHIISNLSGNFLCKLDTIGNVKWATNLSGYSGYQSQLSINTDGNIFTNGMSNSGNHCGSKLLTYKHNPAGTILWGKNLFSQCLNAFYAGGIVPKNNDLYMIANTWMCPSYTYCYQQLLLAKYDSIGNLSVLDTIKITGNQLSNTQIITDSNGDFIVSGTLSGNIKIGNDSLSTNKPKIFVAKFSDKSITSIRETTLKDDIIIYPNPSSGIFTFNSLNHPNASLAVWDLLGNCLLRKNCKGEANPKIDLSLHPKGIYFLEILSDNLRIVKKVSVQ